MLTEAKKRSNQVYLILAIKNILKGLNRISVNTNKTLKELNPHWEVLTEAIQTILRKNGQLDAYEKLKELTDEELEEKLHQANRVLYSDDIYDPKTRKFKAN